MRRACPILLLLAACGGPADVPDGGPPDAARTYVPEYYFVVGYGRLGDREKALDLLERAWAERNAPLVFLNVDPALDPIRDDPRFIRIRDRMGFA